MMMTRRLPRLPRAFREKLEKMAPWKRGSWTCTDHQTWKGSSRPDRSSSSPSAATWVLAWAAEISSSPLIRGHIRFFMERQDGIACRGNLRLANKRPLRLLPSYKTCISLCTNLQASTTPNRDPDGFFSFCVLLGRRVIAIQGTRHRKPTCCSTQLLVKFPGVLACSESLLLVFRAHTPDNFQLIRLYC